MFENLSDRFQKIVKDLTGRGRLTEANMRDTLKEVRLALLDADVAYSVVKHFVERVRSKALGQQVMTKLSPGQALIKIVHEQLIETLGNTTIPLNLATQPPAIILMAGLQGSGKTTSTMKLAQWIRQQLKKKVMVVSTDIYRPAAIEQLTQLAQQNDIAFFEHLPGLKPLEITQHAIERAQKQFFDVLIIDTAGRLHVDSDMMKEIQSIHRLSRPIETLFVVDSMTGQDAANSAKAFHEALPITGVILTKIDGDARGGAALSIREITGKPIKFAGTGEKSDAFEVFHPDRIASRILGMGDVLSLIEQVEQTIDHEKAKELAKKVQRGKEINFEDFRSQLLEMKKMGGLHTLMEKLPGMDQFKGMKQAVESKMGDKSLDRMIAIINSMTKEERRFPLMIRESRKIRIAKGSGTRIQEVNQLLKQFTMMQKALKKMGKLTHLMRNFSGKMPFNIPPA